MRRFSFFKVCIIFCSRMASLKTFRQSYFQNHTFCNHFNMLRVCSHSYFYISNVGSIYIKKIKWEISLYYYIPSQCVKIYFTIYINGKPKVPIFEKSCNVKSSLPISNDLGSPPKLNKLSYSDICILWSCHFSKLKRRNLAWIEFQ